MPPATACRRIARREKGSRIRKKKELIGDFKNAGREWRPKGDPEPDHDTAKFAVHTIRRWWKVMGRRAYPDTTALLITADAGGSNGSRGRLWKWELQQFANRTGLAITVCHFPPGTSKWNKIEHRLFSHIAMHWRGKPLVDLATIVTLIGETTTDTGLRIRSEMDDGHYPQAVKITDAQMAQLQLTPHAFHGEWNYTLHPRGRKQ